MKTIKSFTLVRKPTTYIHVFILALLITNLSFAGKLDVPTELMYPNVIPPLKQLGGTQNINLATELNAMQDAVFLDNKSMLISESGSHQIFVMDVDGNISKKVGGFGGDICKFNTPRGLYIVGNRIFVIDTGNRRIQVLDLNLKCLSQFEIRETSDPYDIAVIKGHIFISDNTDGLIYKYARNPFKFVGPLRPEFNKQPLRLPMGLAVHGNHLVIADSGNNRIIVSDIEGNALDAWGDWGSYSGQMAMPSDVAVFRDVIFVADQINHRLQAFSSQGEFLYQWGRHPPTSHEGLGRIHYPSIISVNSSGQYVTVCESIESRCQIFGDITRDTRIAKVNDSAWWEKATRFHYGTTGATGHSGCGGGCHRNMAYKEYLAVSEPDTHSVLLFRLDSDKKRGVKPKFITRIGGRGTKYGKLIQPSGILFDSHKESLWVSDRGNLRSEEFVYSEKPQVKNSTRSNRTSAKTASGSGSSKFRKAMLYRTTDAIAYSPKARKSIAPVGEPSHMARLKDRRILMVDPPLGKVHVFTPDMEYESTWSYYGNGKTRMIKPLGITVDLIRDRVYVVDQYAFKVKVFNTKGRHLFDFGGPGVGPEQFVAPFGVTVNSKGSIFVTDTAKNEIKKFSQDGKLISRWGSWGVGPGEFYKPKGITTTKDDMLVVMDFGNHRAQVFDSNGKFLSTFGIDENPNSTNKN